MSSKETRQYYYIEPWTGTDSIKSGQIFKIFSQKIIYLECALGRYMYCVHNSVEIAQKL